MAGPQTNVDVPGMQAAVPHFEQGVSEVNSARGAMEEQAGSLIWTGDAAQAFHSAIQEWCENAQTVSSALEQMKETLNTTIAKYQNVHSDTHDTANSVRNAMQSSPGLSGF